MKCIYCNKSVFGGDCLTVPNEGPAHMQCYAANQALKRTFQNLNITALNDTELQELKELVLAEENARGRGSSDDDVELF